MSGAAFDRNITLAIIGGTGLYQLAALEQVETLVGDTVYGAPSGPVGLTPPAISRRRRESGFWMPRLPRSLTRGRGPGE